jgi:hypothetical protein
VEVEEEYSVHSEVSSDENSEEEDDDEATVGEGE